jgi:hypothetical protein
MPLSIYRLDIAWDAMLEVSRREERINKDGMLQAS